MFTGEHYKYSQDGDKEFDDKDTFLPKKKSKQP